jgi:hypothetical protein
MADILRLGKGSLTISDCHRLCHLQRQVQFALPFSSSDVASAGLYVTSFGKNTVMVTGTDAPALTVTPSATSITNQQSFDVADRYGDQWVTSTYRSKYANEWVV